MTDVLPNVRGDGNAQIQAMPVVPVASDGTVYNSGPGQAPSVTGTISSISDTVDLDAPGSASAVISITGTFSGSLRFVGSVDETDGVLGGRLAFRYGVGSVGTNVISSDGSEEINREYRIVSGGQRIVVDATEWTSGMANITITASYSPSVVFVNGPVHGSFEEAQRASRAFSALTGVSTIGSGDYLKYKFENPAGSGKRCFVSIRAFSNNRTGSDDPLEVVFVLTPDDITSPTTVSPNNLGPDKSITSPVIFTHKTENSELTGTELGSRILPINGVWDEISVSRIVDPGQSFGYYVEGAGGGALTNQARASMTVVWYEEDVE